MKEGEKMEKFSDLVICVDDKDYRCRAAGHQLEWKKSLILDYSMLLGLGTDRREEVKVSMVFPGSVTNRMKNEMKGNVNLDFMHIAKEVSAPYGVVEYYESQNIIKKEDNDIFVVDMWNTFTDICHFRNENGSRKLIKVFRMEFGYSKLVEMVVEQIWNKLSALCIQENNLSKSILVYNVENLVSRMIYHRFEKDTIHFQTKEGFKELGFTRGEFLKIENRIVSEIISILRYLEIIWNIDKCKLILSGKIFEDVRLVNIIIDSMSSMKVYAYKAKDIVLIGASVYCQNHYDDTGIYEINYIGQTLLKQQTVMGDYCNLNKEQQRAYQKLLYSIKMRKSKVSFTGLKKDVYEVYCAVRNDFPEIDIIWSYNDGKMWIDKEKREVTLELIYRVDGDKILSTINRKINGIIKKSIKNKTLSDYEFLEVIYNYIAKEYCYTKKISKRGDFPKYAYTLETLLYSGVCHGYAISMVYLCRLLQIPCIYICGDADGNEFGGHAWNVVHLINGKFRHLDITWDLGNVRSKKYWLLDDISMNARKHFWKKMNYPVCA